MLCRENAGESMTDQALRRRAARPLLAAAVLLALSACGSEPAAPTTTQTAQAQTAQAQPGAAPGQVAEERMATTNCRTPADGRVHFSLGQAVFAVPGDDVRTVLPPGVTPATPADQVIERLRQLTTQGGGCPESPLDAALLGVAGPANDPLLADAIALFRSGPGGISTPYGNLTRDMLANSGRCQPAEAGLIACQATEQDGDQQVQSLYLVATEPGRRLSFGGPLAARCIVVEDRVRGCEIVDELPGGVGVRAPLRALPQSADALAAAHGAAMARVQPLRL